MELKKIELNEAFAESMPASIRTFLTSPRGRRWLSELVGSKNIAVDRANFIKYDIPKTNRDPIFKDETKLKFYVFNNDSVYITTVNDDWQYISHNGNFVYNKWLPAKALIENSKEIYYLDLTDPNNFNTDTKTSRADNKIGGDSPYYRVTGNINSDKNINYGTKWQINSGKLKIDKSGYIVDPKRLANKMIDLGLFDPAKKLKASYKKIVDVKKDLMEAMNEVTIDSAGTEIVNSLRYAMSSFTSAISSYNNLVSALRNLQAQKDNNYIDNKEYSKRSKSTLDDFNRRIDSSLDDVNRYISSFVGIAVDWDTEDTED